jgi:NADH-quinone oxidoreductase subunit N
MSPGFSSADAYYLLPELIITAGAVVLLVVDALSHANPRGQRWLAWITLGVLGGSGLMIAVASGAEVTVARGMYAVDGFAVFFKLLFMLAAALTVLMSNAYLATEGSRPGDYYFLLLTATLGMMVMASGIDLVTLFIGLETMAVSFYILAGFLKPNRRSNEASVKYFLLGAFSLGVLLYGMSLLYGLTGSTQLRVIAPALAAGVPGRLLAVAVMLLVAGMGFKIAAVPFHMWAPDVYEGAPTPVAAFLSVGSKAAAFAMLLRIFFEGLPSFRVDGLGTIFGQPLGWTSFFYVLSIASMTIGNLAALTQTNVKRMLAYSAIAHAGYLLIGIVAATPRGVTATLVYLTVYAFMQLGAFGIIALLRRGSVAGDELQDFSGLSSRNPAAAVAMLLFMLSLGGIPPTGGFMGKLWLFSSAIEAGYIGLAVIGVLNSVVSLYYYVRVVVYMWIRREDPATPPIVRSWALSVATAVAVAGTLVLGVYPRLLFDLAQASAATLGRADQVLGLLR